jgi:hypothetical protein
VKKLHKISWSGLDKKPIFFCAKHLTSYTGHWSVQRLAMLPGVTQKVGRLEEHPEERCPSCDDRAHGWRVLFIRTVFFVLAVGAIAWAVKRYL